MNAPIARTIPVCPDCNRVMLHADWDTPRPRAICHHCGKSHYYNAEGRIVMSAKTRKAA